MQPAVVVALPRAAPASDIRLYKEQRRGMATAATPPRRYTLMSSWALALGVETAAARIGALISAFSVLPGAVWEYFSGRD